QVTLCYLLGRGQAQRSLDQVTQCYKGFRPCEPRGSPAPRPQAGGSIAIVRPSSADRSTAVATSSTCRPGAPRARWGRPAAIASAISCNPIPRVPRAPSERYGTRFQSSRPRRSSTPPPKSLASGSRSEPLLPLIVNVLSY